MTIPEDRGWLRFIAAEPARTAKLATVRKDGRPHVAPVWVALDGDQLVFNTAASNVKGHAIRRDPRVALCFDDETPPFAYVIVEGTAEVSEEPDDLLRWATIIAGRYMGAEQADAYGGRNGVPGELVVRVTPTHVIVAQDIAD